MIFRLDGEVGLLLALAVVIKEWRRRNDEPVYVETYTPEIFSGNPDVVCASECINEVGEFYDLNTIRWIEIGRPVVDVFAEHILGDRNIAVWRPYMSEIVSDIVGKTGLVATCSFNGRVPYEPSKLIVDVLRSKGYVVDDLSGMSDWHKVRSRISMSDLFVGEDGDAAAVSFTTDTPSVVCYTNRIPEYFLPYRRGIPFEPIIPDRTVCQNFKHCYQGSKLEFSKWYSQPCSNDNKYACRSMDFSSSVSAAIERIGDKA